MMLFCSLFHLKGVPLEGPLKHMICHKREVRLPAKCYDTVDGYYDPKKYVICSYETGTYTMDSSFLIFTFLCP